MTRSILNNFFQLTIAIDIYRFADFPFSLEAVGALEDCHLICAGVRTKLFQRRVSPFSATTNATRNMHTHDVMRSLSTFFSIFTASTLDPENFNFSCNIF